MKIKLAKKILCEVEVFSGEKLIDKYIALEKRGKKSEAERPMEGVCGRQTEYNMDRTGE